jgi:putative N6-adenine-specific DNA methylase
MLAAAGWRGTPGEGGALHDPCCGSGTIAIEAAQIAMGMARAGCAGSRSSAPPLQTPMARQLQRLRSLAAARVHAPAVPTRQRRLVPMVDFARRNAARAGVAEAIVFHGGDALERPPPPLPADLPGTLMVNPPYGERIEVAGKAAVPERRGDEPGSDREAASDFFPRLATHWKHAYTAHPAGWTAWILSPDMRLPARCG